MHRSQSTTRNDGAQRVSDGSTGKYATLKYIHKVLIRLPYECFDLDSAFFFGKKNKTTFFGSIFLKGFAFGAK